MVDLVIGLFLVVLAAGALHCRTLYGSLTLFFSFGMLMTLAWGRLRVPDLALAEAAIGAGLSGALLFNALEKSRPERVERRRPHHVFSAALVSFLLLLLLLQSLWSGAGHPSILPAMTEQRLGQSGVSHPVTAVLLNFRSWDTLMELTVLLLALLAVKCLRPTHTPAPRPWPVLVAWSKMLAPVTVLVAGYLLWRGSHAPGGAFQAGALVAAGAVMLRLNHLLPPLRWSNVWVRCSILGGVCLFLGIAVATQWRGSGWLVYPEGAASALIMAIELVGTVSIATALTLLVVGEGEELQS